ncbi:MAG: phosphatase PAP2 family protein [Desulfobacterales bacterium]|jgi:membrane-associated phospholipid phosphatase
MLIPEDILDAGIQVVLWFQQFRPALDLPFKSLTFLGNLEFFLIFMPFIYWCLDPRRGTRLLILFLISAYVNSFAKVMAHQPRPFQYDARVRALVHAGGGGLPSGHTQSAVVVWGYLALHFRRRWLWIFASLLMIGIPLSRLYLGVHFPTDLVGGYILGAVLLVLYLRFAFNIEAWLDRKGLIWQMAAAVLLPIGLILIHPGEALYALSACGVLMGFATGIIAEQRWIQFCADASPLKKLLRYLVGMLILLGIWMGLRKGFAALEPAGLWRFIRYALVGLWAGLGAPWMFVRLKLAETE